MGAFELSGDGGEQDDEGKESDKVHGRNRALHEILPRVADRTPIVDFPPNLCDDDRMPLRTIAVLLADQSAVFEFGVLHEVFGIDRSGEGVPAFNFRVCTEHPDRPVELRNGLSLNVQHGLEALEGADLVAVAATVLRSFPPAVVAAVRDAYERGAIVLSVCSGAFLLGATGLLDGRACATHWMNADELAESYPLARVDRDVLFVDEGRIITSAGTAAGIDACLHLVRRELGAGVATQIARRMVVPPQRDGGQRQFVDTPIPACTTDSLRTVLAWMEEHLDQDLPAPVLARQAAMSERTFARRFVAETGTTPARWLVLQRIHRARQLLEASDLGIEQVASRSGFGSAALLRHHFTRAVGVAPTDYRRTFSQAGPAGHDTLEPCLSTSSP